MWQGSPASHNARSALGLVCVLALGLGLGGCVGYDGDFDRGYIADQRTMEQVQIGSTTKPQALALMGTPSTTSTAGGGAWYYIGRKMQRSLAFMPATLTDHNVIARHFDTRGHDE